MDTHLLFAWGALAVSVGSAIYGWRTAKRIRLGAATSLCTKFNRVVSVGSEMIYETEDPVQGNVIVRTTSAAKVQRGIAVVTVERFGAVPINHRIYPFPQ